MSFRLVTRYMTALSNGTVVASLTNKSLTVVLFREVAHERSQAVMPVFKLTRSADWLDKKQFLKRREVIAGEEEHRSH
jgi:hypothetical protein